MNVQDERRRVMLQASIAEFLTGKLYELGDAERQLVYSSLEHQDVYEEFFEHLAKYCI